MVKPAVKKARTVKIRFSKNKKKRWFWTAISPNGKKFFGSMEPDGFRYRSSAVKNFNSVVRMFALRNYIFE